MDTDLTDTQKYNSSNISDSFIFENLLVKPVASELGMILHVLIGL